LPVALALHAHRCGQYFVALSDEEFGLCMLATGGKDSEAAIATREDIRFVHNYMWRSRRRRAAREEAVDVRCSEAQPAAGGSSVQMLQELADKKAKKVYVHSFKDIGDS